MKTTCSDDGSAVVSDGALELGDDGVAGRVGVVDEEAAIVRVVRVKCEPEQPALATRCDAVGDVEERLLDDRRVGGVDDLDGPTCSTANRQ